MNIYQKHSRTAGNKFVVNQPILRPMLYFIFKPFVWLALQIWWLVFTLNATMDWNWLNATISEWRLLPFSINKDSLFKISHPNIKFMWRMLSEQVQYNINPSHWCLPSLLKSFRKPLPWCSNASNRRTDVEKDERHKMV